MAFPSGRAGWALTLRKLVAAAGFFMTEFLTLYRTWVAAQKTSSLQRRTELRVQLHQHAGNAQHGGFGLAFHATTIGIDLYIKLIGRFDSLQRAHHLVLE